MTTCPHENTDESHKEFTKWLKLILPLVKMFPTSLSETLEKEKYCPNLLS